MIMLALNFLQRKPNPGFLYLQKEYNYSDIAVVKHYLLGYQHGVLNKDHLKFTWKMFNNHKNSILL
jgi:hypothetical protein